MRVIAGSAKGRKLQRVPGNQTRPIMDRVKEALFNILGQDILESAMLDMFAGTGSVGIEALSRGASYVRFVDLNRRAIQTIHKNLEVVNFEKKANVLQGDALFLLKKQPDCKFDYIFVAPPQYKQIGYQALMCIDSFPDWLTVRGQVILQIDPYEYESKSLRNLVEFDKRRYGNTQLVFYAIQ